MAWRDSRGSRKRLLLFLSSITLGVAALVAINSFGYNLEKTIDREAEALLGADLSLESNHPFQPETEALIDSLGGEQSRRISFSSMAYFPKNGGTRLSTVRVIKGGFPFYGAIETAPPSAAEIYQDGLYALVDGTLFEQFDLQVGDSVRIGRVAYRIAGRLEKSPRESQAVSLFSPRIFIPMDSLDSELLQMGSRAEYEVYFKFPEGTDVEALKEEIRPHLDEYRIGSDTVEEIKNNWNEGLTNLYQFLSLAGFIALLLGGLGVAGTIYVYVRQRIDSVAVLRCLGAGSWRTVAIYLVQSLAMGLTGSVAGALLGVAVQSFVPRVLADVLPFDVEFVVSWPAIFLGLGIGIGVTVLFALLPLLAVRDVSPLRALRVAVEQNLSKRFDPYRLGAYLMIVIGLALLAMFQAPTPVFGVAYLVGVGVVFGLLGLVARLVMWLMRRFFPSTWSYPWRQGLANLYRPNNQTAILVLILGFGTFLIMSLFVVQRTLLAQINVSMEEGQPDMVLFDVQHDQLQGVTEIVEQHDLPILETVPIVTMRIAKVNGVTVEEMEKDSTRHVGWAFNREYRSSYRDHLTESEQVIAGTFIGRYDEGSGAIPISIEAEVAGELGVGLGDSIEFNVQGVPMQTRISSIREVDWRRLSTNFFVVFPAGVLEEAPQFYVVLTRAETAAVSASVQKEVIQAYPNVSAIDLSLVLTVFDAIFSRISFVVRIMALFSVLTGLIVLAGAVVVSRFQRIEESVLLKTLGASRWTVIRITLIEYFLLGVFAAVTGLALSVAAGWALARFLFNTPFVFEFYWVLAAVLVVSGLTVLVGFINSRGFYRHTALEVLRSEI